jgi:glycosyltransferase involved in cell wall biosynthesis
MSGPWGRRFDSVVMLTLSNWTTESRSNRYHYASRFAKHVPVLFVQPDAEASLEEPTEISGLNIVHVGAKYDDGQLAPVRRLLERRGLSNPLLWIYNPNYIGLEENFGDAIRVYHATEDYFTDWGPHQVRSRLVRSQVLTFRRRLVLFLQKVDLVVSVTHGVGHRLRSFARYHGPLLVLENGCDFSFWQAEAHPPTDRGAVRDVAIYQGGINHRLDVPLLLHVMTALPAWEFRFCGPVGTGFGGMEALRQKPNFRYLGNLRPEVLRAALYAATVGLIPYVQDRYITRQSLPLKAFEYAACGLPVVSVPIASLARHQIFAFASTAEEFAASIARVGATRFEPRAIETRTKAARLQSYDHRFHELTEFLDRMTRAAPSRAFGARMRAVSLKIAAQWNRFLSNLEREAH